MQFHYTRTKILTLTGSLHARVLAMARESKCTVITRTLHDLGGHVLAPKPFRTSFSTCIDSCHVAGSEYRQDFFPPSRKCTIRSTGIMTPYHIGHKFVQGKDVAFGAHSSCLHWERGRGAVNVSEAVKSTFCAYRSLF